jgi:hypothetical protein
VNKSITKLDLTGNDLNEKAREAIRKALEVRLSRLHTDSICPSPGFYIHFVYLFVCLSVEQSQFDGSIRSSTNRENLKLGDTHPLA